MLAGRDLAGRLQQRLDLLFVQPVLAAGRQLAETMIGLAAGQLDQSQRVDQVGMQRPA
jgi:hypothetical protein